MYYTLVEAIARSNLGTSLNRQQITELLNLLDDAPDLITEINCSDLTCGFLNEDEAHEPLGIVDNYADGLIDGKKVEREAALKKIKEELSDWALEHIHSVEFAMESWNRIIKLAEGIN